MAYQNQIARQIELGQAGQDAAEQQQGKGHDQDHRQQLVGQEIADVFDPVEVAQHPPGDPEQPPPKDGPHDSEHQQPGSSAAGAAGSPRASTGTVRGLNSSFTSWMSVLSTST
jgi:hypothetical protein